jgi:hypothetical protein
MLSSQVDRSPNAVRTEAAETVWSPRLPRTSTVAARLEGDREATSSPRRRPRTSEPSLRCASRRVKRAVQVCTGDRSSCGSSTERRYDSGEPPKPYSLEAVRPPEVEKKNVWATSPPTVTTRARVSRTAAVVVATSDSTPR